MSATLHHLPVIDPQAAPFPVMNARELAEFWAAVELLRAERARHESAASGSAAILAAVPT